MRNNLRMSKQVKPTENLQHPTPFLLAGSLMYSANEGVNHLREGASSSQDDVSESEKKALGARHHRIRL